MRFEMPSANLVRLRHFVAMHESPSQQAAMVVPPPGMVISHVSAKSLVSDQSPEAG